MRSSLNWSSCNSVFFFQGRTYSDTKDLTSCKPCTKCRRGDIIREECTRKNDSVCERDSNDSKDKTGPGNTSVWPTISKPYRTTTNGSWIPSSTGISRECCTFSSLFRTKLVFCFITEETFTCVCEHRDDLHSARSTPCTRALSICMEKPHGNSAKWNSTTS